MFDSTGAIDYAISFDPYGVPTEQYVGANNTNLGFTGEQTNANGLVYLRARHYDPGLGVFLSRDPVLGAIGGPSIRFNGYAYAGANPVNYVDPDGEFFWLGAFAAALIGGGLGLGIGWELFVNQREQLLPNGQFDVNTFIDGLLNRVEWDKVISLTTKTTLVSAAIAGFVLSPTGALIGAGTNVLAGATFGGGYSNLDELLVDSLVGLSFGGLAGGFLKAVPAVEPIGVSAGGVESAIYASSTRLVEHYTKRALGMGLINAAQGIGGRVAHNVLLQGDEDILNLGRVLFDFSLGFAVARGTDALMIRDVKADAFLQVRYAQSVTRGAQKAGSNTFWQALSIITGTNVSGPFVENRLIRPAREFFQNPNYQQQSSGVLRISPLVYNTRYMSGVAPEQLLCTLSLCKMREGAILR